MNKTTTLAAVAAFVLVIKAALGQSLLSQAERLQPPAGATTPPAASAAPRGGYLGYTPVEGTDDTRGVLVETVKTGAPAALGGLQDGDLITAVNGKKMTLAQFDDYLKTTSAGQKLQLTVERAGRPQHLTVTLGARATDVSPPSTGSFSAPSTAPNSTAPSLSAPSTPASPAGTPEVPSLAPPSSSDPLPGAGTLAPARPTETPPRSIQAQPLDLGSPPGTTAEPDITGGRPSSRPSASSGGGASLGVTVVPLTDDARARLGVPVRRGALIDRVKQGSAAEQAGLPVGAVIARIDNRDILSADDVVAAIKSAQPGQEVEVTYYDRNRLNRKMVRLAAAGGEGTASEPGISGSLPAPPAASSPALGERSPRSGSGGALGNRPILRNLGQMAADTLARPAELSTVYDPSVVATLQNQVAALTEQNRVLEERLRALESKLGGAPAGSPLERTAPALSPPGSLTPAPSSFGAPGPAGPGFGPAIGGTGTTP